MKIYEKFYTLIPVYFFVYKLSNNHKKNADTNRMRDARRSLYPNMAFHSLSHPQVGENKMPNGPIAHHERFTSCIYLRHAEGATVAPSHYLPIRHFTLSYHEHVEKSKMSNGPTTCGERFAFFVCSSHN